MSKLYAIIFTFLHAKISYHTSFWFFPLCASGQKTDAHIKHWSTHLIPEQLMIFTIAAQTSRRKSSARIRKSLTKWNEKKWHTYTRISWNIYLTYQRNVDNYAKTFEINIIRISLPVPKMFVLHKYTRNILRIFSWDNLEQTEEKTMEKLNESTEALIADSKETYIQWHGEKESAKVNIRTKAFAIRSENV